jgi:predicted transcriptional regulator
MLKIYNFLKDSRTSFTIDELVELLNIPERTLYEYLNEMENEGLIEKADRNGKIAYRVAGYTYVSDVIRLEREETTITISTTKIPQDIYGTKIDEIVSRYKYIKKFEKEGIRDELRKTLKDLDPQRIWKETIEEIKTDDKILAQYPWISLTELDAIEVRGDGFILKHGQIPPKSLNGVFIGTDGSLNRLDLVFQIFRIPTMMNLVFTSAAAVKIAVKNGKKIPIDPKDEIKRRPAYPLYSAEEYVEELGTAFPHLSEGERNMVAYTMLDIVHFGLDHESIRTSLVGLEEQSSDLNPIMLFHDGRVIPSNIHCLDLLGLHPRPGHPEDRARRARALKTWDALIKAAEVRNLAETHGVTYIGVVKRPVKPYFALIVDKILHENFDFPRGSLRNDALAMSLILDAGESSCALSINPKQINLGTPQLESSAENVLQRDYLTYAGYLEKLTHWVFYLNADSHVCRYEFFDGNGNPESNMNEIAKYALTLASPSPRGNVSDLRSIKRDEIVPSPIVAADYEANEWGKKISVILENHILSALRGALKRY